MSSTYTIFDNIYYTKKLNYYIYMLLHTDNIYENKLIISYIKQLIDCFANDYDDYFTNVISNIFDQSCDDGGIQIKLLSDYDIKEGNFNESSSDTSDEDIYINKVINGYIIINHIGNGNMGKVYKAINKYTMNEIAIKIIDNKKKYTRFAKNRPTMQKEIMIMKKIKHPNIVKYYDTILDIDTNTIFILMEYIDGNNLTNISNVSKTNAQKYLYHIAKGIEYLHSNNIIHRDLKLDNILLNSLGFPIIIDFGVSSIMDDRRASLRMLQGTPLYMAPEIIKECKVTYAGDVWAFGVISYFLIKGKYPFNCISMAELNDMFDDNYTIDLDGCANEEIQLIKSTLSINITDRATIENVLKLPYFDSYNETYPEDIKKIMMYRRLSIETNLENSTSSIDALLSQSLKSPFIKQDLIPFVLENDD